MRRLFLIASVIAASFGVGLVAANERVTFLLTNGERLSGTVAFHTDERTNIRADRNEFALTTPSQEVEIPFNQVAALEFVGGTPPTSELAALTPGAHMLAMRNGQTRKGRLVDLIGGDTVRWENEGGGREDLPILQVARIYVNAASVRTTYNYQPPAQAAQAPAVNDAGTPRAGGARGRVNTGRGAVNTAPGREVRVSGASAWTDSNIAVRVGQMLQFASTGTTFFRRSDTDAASAAGKGDAAGNGFPVPSAPIGALIGRIGNGTPFAIGATSDAIRMPATGRLMLGINDDFFDDNSGYLTVTVR